VGEGMCGVGEVEDDEGLGGRWLDMERLDSLCLGGDCSIEEYKCIYWTLLRP
jgi:hypothetical protein